MTNQQRVAHHALCLGSPGAARAALRILTADSFEDWRTAGEALETLRDRMSDPDDVLAALYRLISLAPAHPRPEDTGQFLSVPPSRRQQTDTGSD